MIPDVDRQQVAAHIETCHEHDIQFTNLLNATCLHGREFDRDWRTAFTNLLDELVEMGVDRVTVAIPYLIEVVKARHPNLLINVSSFTQINGVEGAQRFARLGVEEINLDFMSIQRDFKLMAAMVQAVNVKFQVLANHTCLYHCPSRSYHANLSSHASQCSACSSQGDGAILDYCVLECLHTKLTDPTVHPDSKKQVRSSMIAFHVKQWSPWKTQLTQHLRTTSSRMDTIGLKRRADSLKLHWTVIHR